MEDPHLVNLSDRDIEDNEEMRRIVTRLANAAPIPEIRHTMNIEDEIFSELENLEVIPRQRETSRKPKDYDSFP